MANRAKAAVQQLVGRIPRDFAEPGIRPEEPALEIDFGDPREGALMRRAQALIAFAQRSFGSFQVGDIEREAAGVDELAVAEMHVGTDQHVLDRAVLRLEPRSILVELFTSGQAGEDVVDHGLVGVEFRDVAADIFLAGVPEKIEFRLIDAQDRTVRGDPV